MLAFKNMIKNERDLWKLLKKSSAGILFDRIENWAVPGVPDLLGYNQNKTFFTLELKANKRLTKSAFPRTRFPGTCATVPAPSSLLPGPRAVIKMQLLQKCNTRGACARAGPPIFFYMKADKLWTLFPVA